MRYSNESKEKANGVVYTPMEMAEYVANQILRYSTIDLEKADEIDVLDPAVGEGELLVAMIKAIKDKAKAIRVVGFEMDAAVGLETEAKLQEMFPEVKINIKIGDFISALDKGEVGLFDFVIANPPYVRTQIMGSQRAQQIAEKLSLTGRIDIYYAFLVCTKDVLKPAGVAGYITSNKFMTIKAGNAVRNYMIQNYHLYHITDLGDTKLFNASVLPCIMVFSLGNTTPDEVVKFSSVYESKDTSSAKMIPGIFDAIDESGFYMIPDKRTYRFQQGKMHSVDIDSLWTIESDENQEWLSRVEANTWLHFSQIGKIRVGIKTTADNVFIGDNWSGENENLELLRPLITHRNAGQIIPNNSDQWKVLYTHTSVNGKKVAVNIEDYPKSKLYLESHYEQLSSREYVKKANRNWYEIWVPQNPDSWAHKKIVFRDISERPEFWFDESGAVVNGDCYWIDIFPEVLEDVIYLALAVANSRFIEKYYDIKFNTKLYSGKRRYQTQYVDSFPIPYYDLDLAKKAINIVKEILRDKENNFAERKEQLDHIIDELFA